MDTTDIVEKLIQLALKNPNREEAAAAALKAVALIDKFQIPLGADIKFTRDTREWQPPSEDFQRTVDDIFAGRSPSSQSEAGQGWSPSGAPDGLKVATQSYDTTTREDAWRTRMVDAWRAIREERRKLESEVYRLELHFRTRYWTPDNPKPWR